MHFITKQVVMTAALALATGLLCSGCRIARKLGESCSNVEQHQPARETQAPPPAPLPEVNSLDAALEPAALNQGVP